ncbi:MAG: bifunctional 2-polyprenyl-6-hydroxyphenol methylase/3-demethylubiquinol 3-O-methyltransferase UbiG [Gammaproteobacteria bacterium]
MNESTDTQPNNVDPAEIDKFNDIASRWWDPNGEMGPLHRMNPLRLDYIDARAGIAGKQCLDIGCGGGILSEGLAARGGDVTGIDLAPASLAVAKLHLAESGHDICYIETSADELAATVAGSFDLVTCLEVLEHVPDPAQLIACCAQLVRPGGDVVLSTINRNLKSFAMAIVGAEYVLGMLPKGTHTYAKFIQPAELDAWGQAAGLTLADLTGLHYSPLSGAFSAGGDVDVNYFAHFTAAPAS